MKAWSRSYSPRNTRLLRTLLKDGRIKVDAENGIIFGRRGVPLAIESNWCGYCRFRVKIKKNGKWVNAWFFVHKAIFLSENPKLKKHFEINHIDFNTANNRRSNLEYIHRRENLLKRRPTEDAEPAF